MPTSAEADRIAQEDAMMRQIAMQQAAQRQANAARNTAAGLQSDAAKAQIQIANIQADAQRDAANTLAGREAANNEALYKRQLALAEAGKGMTEADKARLAIEERKLAANPQFAAQERIAARRRGMNPEAGSGISHRGAPSGVPYTMPDERGGAKPAPTRSVAATDVSKKWGSDSDIVYQDGEAVGITTQPYDMTGFNSDVAGIAENVRVARNQSPGMLNYDDLPTMQPGSQGAFVRDPTGTLRQVHFPAASSSQTPDRAAIAKLVQERMMPTPPAGIAPAAPTKQPITATPATPAPQAPVAAPEKLPFDQAMEDDLEAAGMPHTQAYKDWMEDRQDMRGRKKVGEAVRVEQIKSDIAALMAKPKLTPKEEQKLNAALGEYNALGYGTFPGTKPTRSSPTEFAKADVEGATSYGDFLGKQYPGWFSGVQEDAIPMMRERIDGIKKNMREAGYSEADIQQVVKQIAEGLGAARTGYLIKGGKTWSEPDIIRATAEYQ